MALIKMLVLRVIALISRYPWAIAIFGFVSGVASFFLVEREQEKFAQLVSALMLVSWVWLALENLLQRSVSSWFGFKLPPPLLSFATQLVHQESLFFVIPFFFVTTVWNGGQMVFTSLLIAAAFISIVDPVYYRWLAARRWLYFIFHGVTLFAVLLTALPIIFQLPTPKSYLLSLVIALLLTLPGVVRALPFTWWKRLLITTVLIAVVWTIGVNVRQWIPPATLRLTEVAITDRIDDVNRSPQNELKVVTVEQLRTGLYAYTAIRAPRGLNERIYHVWRRNGRVVDRIALDINGGREAGYRAWTHKLNFPPYPSGRWQIHVVTEANQVIGILRFQVVESAEEAVIDDDHIPVEEILKILPAFDAGDEQQGDNDSSTPSDENVLQDELPADEPGDNTIDEENNDEVDGSDAVQESPDTENADAENSDKQSAETKSAEVESSEIKGSDINGSAVEPVKKEHTPDGEPPARMNHNPAEETIGENNAESSEITPEETSSPADQPEVNSTKETPAETTEPVQDEEPSIPDAGEQARDESPFESTEATTE